MGRPWNRPNTHGLKVMIDQTMAALQNGRFCMTDKFELAHQPNKRTGKGSQSGAGGMGGIVFALKWSTRKHALKAMYRGLRWGPNHEYFLSKKVIELIGKSALLRQLPPELYDAIPRKEPMSKTTQVVGSGKWTFNKTFNFDASESEKILLQSGINLSNDVKFDISTRYKYVKKLAQENGGRSIILHEGDHATVIYGQKEAYCQVEKMVVVEHNGAQYLYFFCLVRY